MKHSVVKSAARTLDILELFAQRKEPLTAKQVEVALGYPSSSTIMLLKSLNELGYLRFNRLNRTYLPTLRVALLGNWLRTSALASDLVLKVAHRLHEKVGETIFISSPNETSMKAVYLIPGRQAINLNLIAGFTIDIVNSSAGLAYLATLERTQVDDIINRTNRNNRKKPPYCHEEIHKKIRQVKKLGYASVYDVVPAAGAITMAIPTEGQTTEHVLGIGGLADRVKSAESEYAAHLRTAIREIRLAIKQDRRL